MPASIVPGVGRGVLHLFYRVDRIGAQQLPPGAGKELAEILTDLQARTQLHAFSGLGHKADAMFMAIDPDFTVLREVQSAIESSAAGTALLLDWSYVSLTETSEYTPTEDDERARLDELDLDQDEYDRRLHKFTERMAAYNQNKLEPDMPEWEVACFYPMSHRREGDDNWYSLDYAERRRLMHEHGKSGRAFTGRVLQLVSGSTGLDDWEWGVTLFAHDIGDLKEIVYDLRYDEASARYGEFGPFIIGLRRSPHELIAELGLLDGPA